MKAAARATAAAVALAAAAVLVEAVPPPAGAATIVVTTPIDETTDDGLTSLREAMEEAAANGTSDTVVLMPGENHVIDLCAAGPLTHSEPNLLTIQGAPGTSIQNTCIDVVTIESTSAAGALTVADVEVTGFASGGATIDGAAVHMAAGALRLEGVDLHGFDPGDFGSVVDGGGEMGGPASQVTVVDSAIWGSTGHALTASFGSIEVTGTEIHSTTGHGITGSFVSAAIGDSSIHHVGGGGINLTDGSPLLVARSAIEANAGPGIRTTGQGHTLAWIHESVVAGNGDQGITCGACATVAVTASTVSGNGATAPSGGGGGIVVSWDYDDPADAPVLTVHGSHVVGNVARHRGGGIHVGVAEDDEPTATPAVTTVDSSTVSGNRTEGAFDVDGGGIAVETGTLRIVDGSEVHDNQAGPPGGLTAASGGGIWHRETTSLLTPPALLVDDSSISLNEANSRGGGIDAAHEGTIALTDSHLDGNTAGALDGGGLSAAGADVTLERTTVDGNAADTGGGIALRSSAGLPEGSLAVTASTVSGNSASFAASGGGGVFVNVGGAGADATFVDSTVSGNTSANLGGGLLVAQTSRLALDHTTVVDNSGSDGANVFVAAGTFSVARSVLASPQGSGDGCGTFSAQTVSGGHSFADDTSCGLGPDDLVDPSGPGLGPLADNGGPTATHLPAATSPIGGLVPPAACAGRPDQRGVARPQGAACEAGAIEVVEAASVVGTDGPDVLVGTAGPDVIDGRGGSDIILGLGGDDILLGGDGADIILGGAGDDHVVGGAGPDLLLGEDGDDLLEGGAGGDILVGGPGHDHLDGGAGLDLCLPIGGTTTAC